MNKYANYLDALIEDAKALVNDFFDRLTESVKDGDRIDAYRFIDEDCDIHQHVDSLYIDFEDAFHILQNCTNEETDSGLWEGQEPKQAIITMAFFTYRQELMEATQGAFLEKLEELAEAETNKLNDLKDELTTAEQDLETVQGVLDALEEDDKQELLEAQISALEDKIERLEEEVSEQEDYVDNIESAVTAFE